MSFYDFDHSILDIANDFYEAYKRCAEGKNLHMDELGRHVAEIPAVPTIVNGIFACELYLKSMLSINERRRCGHDLKSLFAHLPIELQDALKEAITAKMSWQFNTFDECLDMLKRISILALYSRKRGFR